MNANVQVHAALLAQRVTMNNVHQSVGRQILFYTREYGYIVKRISRVSESGNTIYITECPYVKNNLLIKRELYLL
jgi:hypothetical protein